MPESPENPGNDAAEISPDDYCKLTAWAAQQAGHLERLPDSNPYKAGITKAKQPHPKLSGEDAAIPGD